jgi:hypothetical protein
MGLDMYLSGKRYLWSSGDHPDSKIATDVSAMFPELTPQIHFGEPGPRVKEISAEAIYWRKANAIHAWFVENIQGGTDDCGNYYADRDLLVQLRDKCKEVLADHSKAGELLPCQQGFFFGNTDYDEWYFKDLERTVKELDECMAWPNSWTFEYQSSW